MLYTVRIEPNRTFLRALMTNFFASSHIAHTLLSHVEAFSAVRSDRQRSQFNELWAKAAKFGPLSEDTIAELQEQAVKVGGTKAVEGYLDRAWNKAAEFGPPHLDSIQKQAHKAYDQDFTNAKAIFFSHLVEFVRNFRVPTKQFQPLQDTDDARLIRDAVKGGLGRLVEELRNNTEIQAIILAEFTPEKMAKPSPAKVAIEQPPLHIRPEPVISDIPLTPVSIPLIVDPALGARIEPAPALLH